MKGTRIRKEKVDLTLMRVCTCTLDLWGEKVLFWVVNKLFKLKKAVSVRVQA